MTTNLIAAKLREVDLQCPDAKYCYVVLEGAAKDWQKHGIGCAWDTHRLVRELATVVRDECKQLAVNECDVSSAARRIRNEIAALPLEAIDE